LFLPPSKTEFTRRTFIKTGAAAIIATVFPSPVWAAIDGLLANNRHLSFYNTHTDETLCCCYYRNGGYSPESLQSINYILRDHRTGDVKAIDTRLLDTLHALSLNLGQQNAAFHIISGYRSAQSNAKLRRKSKNVASRSLHMQGKAIDVRLPNVGTKSLWRAAVKLRAGGVGYYPRPQFVHIDTGRVRYW
jgi:uncharacterized protein YcbK (DUF882 family)